MYAPAGTPDAVIQRYSNAVKRAMSNPAPVSYTHLTLPTNREV